MLLTLKNNFVFVLVISLLMQLLVENQSFEYDSLKKMMYQCLERKQLNIKK